MTDNRFEKLFSNIGIGFVSAVFILVILEVGSYMVISFYYSIKIDDGRNPMQYSDQTISKLYSTDRVDEYRKMLIEIWDREHQYEPLVEHSEARFNGEHLNITSHGYREVANQKEFMSNDNINIFLFGGSTMFASGVKDKETIASYLQDILDKQGYDQPVAIYNFGAGYWYSTLERIKLFKLLTAGYKPDIVVFMDGLNDFSLNRIPDASGQSNQIQKSIESSKWVLALTETNTFQLLSKVVKRFVQTVPKDHGTASIESLVNRLEINREIIHASMKQLGIKTLFIQQPTPYYQYDEENRAVPLTDSMKNQIYKVGERIKTGYQVMEDRWSNGMYSHLNLLWLSGLAIPRSQYIDYVHYSPAYNQRIAQEIFPEILGLIDEK